jgi:hypothetical protein
VLRILNDRNDFFFTFQLCIELSIVTFPPSVFQCVAELFFNVPPLDIGLSILIIIAGVHQYEQIFFPSNIPLLIYDYRMKISVLVPFSMNRFFFPNILI